MNAPASWCSRPAAAAGLLLALLFGTLLPAACARTPAPAPAPPPATAMHHAVVSSVDEGDPPPVALTPAPVPSATPAPPPAAAAPAPSTARTVSAVGVAAPTAARVVDRGSADRRFVALSFDAGADPGYTASILDTLRAQGVIASFGVTGRWAEQNPALLRRIAAEGHHLINHSYDHASFTGRSTSKAPLSAEARRAQLDRTAEVVRSLAGVEFGPYFRPPYGDYDASVNTDIAARGYLYNVMWTVDSLGWRGWAAAAIAERCLARAAPGAIYIFHVGSQSQDAAALPAIIDGLRRQGYAMGSVATLLEG